MLTILEWTNTNSAIFKSATIQLTERFIGNDFLQDF